MTTEEQEWISVTDKLPDYDKKVLVWGEQQGMNPQMGGAYACIAKRQDLSGHKKIDASRIQDEHQFSYMRYVTHWMPLPKSPIKPLPIVDLMPDDVVDEKVGNGEWQRAGGECICLVCKQEYQRHPNFKGRFYWLTQLCDGVLVKL